MEAFLPVNCCSEKQRLKNVKTGAKRRKRGGRRARQLGRGTTGGRHIRGRQGESSVGRGRKEKAQLEGKRKDSWGLIVGSE